MLDSLIIATKFAQNTYTAQLEKLEQMLFNGQDATIQRSIVMTAENDLMLLRLEIDSYLDLLAN